VTWNRDAEDQIAWSSDGQLCIRTGEQEPIQQKLSGYVMLFKGSKVYSIQNIYMQS